MGYSYNIETSKKDMGSTIGLSVCHLLFNIINLFLSTFLIAHIYTLTTDLFSYVLNVGIYQLSTYVFMLISYFLFSFIVDKTNRIWVYRIANIIEVALVVFTIFYGKDLAKIVVLAGLLNGIAHGAYYASYNVLKQEMVSRKSMDNYAVVLMILTKIVNVVCPILLGALIEVSTFKMVAIYVLIINIIQTIISFFIKSKRPNQSKFSIRQFLAKLKNNSIDIKKIKTVYFISIFYGLTTICSVLLNVNIMMHFGSNFSLGLVTSIFALLSVVVLLLLKKLTKVGMRNWVFIIVSFSLFAGGIVFSIFPNVTTLMIFNFGLTVCDVIVATIYDIYRNKNLKESGLYDDIAEHQCVIESIFQFVRIVTFLILIALGLIKSYVLFQVMFVVFITIYAVTPILLMLYEKKFCKNDKNIDN